MSKFGTKSAPKSKSTRVSKAVTEGIREAMFKERLKECWVTVLSVLRRALFTVERYAQTYCVDMSDRGLKVVMESRVENVDKGVRLTIDFIADEGSVLEAVKNREFRKTIRQMEREMKRIKKARIYGRT